MSSSTQRATDWGETTVLDLTGVAHRLDSLWGDSTAVLVWLRHYG